MTSTSERAFWPTLEGALLIILGVLALVSPMFAGVAVAVVIGWLLVLVGVVGLASAFSGRARSHAGWGLASAAIALIAGVVLVFNPLIGALGVALLIGAYLLLDGFALIGLSLRHRKAGDRAWGWLMGSGVLDLVLAAVILTLSAAGSAVAIGIIVGVDLIAAGIALLILRRFGGRPRAAMIDPSPSPRA